MYRTVILCLCLTLLPALAAAAGDPATETQAAKELSGMSIVGNDEAPKSLYIVPWKSSELGTEASLHMSLTADAVPVDRDVFLRQLEFYRVRTAAPTAAVRGRLAVR
jgi:hypothetical protein